MNNDSQLALCDIVDFNSKLINLCETYLGLPLHPTSIPQIRKIVDSDKLAQMISVFSDVREDMIAKLETRSIITPDDLYCPPWHFPFTGFLQPADTYLLELAYKIYSYILYYPRILLYGSEQDPFMILCELQENVIPKQEGWDDVRRGELVGLCCLAPLMKNGILLYLPTEKLSGERVTFYGYHEPTNLSDLVFESDNPSYQLAYAKLTQSHLLIHYHEDIVSYCTVLNDMEKRQPFCQVVSESVAVMIGASDMPIPGQLEYDDLLKLRDETGFEIWRNSVKQAIQYAFDSIKRYCKPSSDLAGELEDRIEQARGAVLKSCRGSAFLRKVMSRAAFIENGFGGASITDADLPLTDISRKEDIGFTSLVNFFGTNPVSGQRVLLKHFSFFEPNDEQRCIG